MKEAKRATNHVNRIKLRMHLNADALFSTMRKGFDKIDDHRKGNVGISLTDTLMSGFAVFSLTIHNSANRRRPERVKKSISTGPFLRTVSKKLRVTFKDTKSIAKSQIAEGKLIQAKPKSGYWVPFLLKEFCALSL